MRKNKVLIITVQKAPNFGACLQAYALWKYVSNLGFECKIIDLLRPYHKGFVYTKGFDVFCSKERSWLLNLRIEYIRPFKRFIRNIFKKKNEIPSINIAPKGFSQVLFDDFNNKIDYTQTYKSIQELYSNPPKADYYITGSDQLWNPTQPYALEPYFLTFVKRGKKISYATSIGVSKISNYSKRMYSKWLASYDCISVRESDGVKLLQSLTNKKVTKCCDPTFLLTREHWREIAVSSQIKHKYIFVFIVGEGEEVYNFADKLSKKLDIPVVTNKKIGTYSFEIYDNIGPLEWLALIRDAEIVLTNSFHGCVFSLIMHTPFRVFVTNNRGSRILDLLEEVGTTSLLCKEETLDLNIPDMIFDNVDIAIEGMREKSINYLLNSISNI